MKTLILYGSNHGFSEKCAYILSEKIKGDCTVSNIKRKKDVTLDEYDMIIKGGSVHAGRIQKHLKEFFIENEQKLKSKKTALYLCCSDYQNVDKYYESEFPKSILDEALVKAHFGHAYYMDKLNFILKAILKKVADVENSEENIRYEQMDILLKEADLI